MPLQKLKNIVYYTFITILWIFCTYQFRLMSYGNIRNIPAFEYRINIKRAISLI